MALKIQKQNWWETDTYDGDSLLNKLENDESLWGPKGPAIVKAWDDGATQRGWGLTGRDGEDGFMARYMRGEFLLRRAEYGFNQGKHNTALVMRSARLLCVDIDGKNGGFEHASQLGALPFTQAEVSKSLNGFHLLYSTPENWDDVEGFGLVPDHIGIVQGVDIRGVGCVYHHPQQRWNNRPVAPAPDWLIARLLERKQQRAATAAGLSKIHTLDEMEILIMQSELVEELNKPIPNGKRNTTLFAIGSKLKLASVPGWDDLVTQRALDLGLDTDEVERLVNNIESYGGTP